MAENKVMVKVLDINGKSLDDCTPAKAKHLLQSGKAEVFLKEPFTIKLNFNINQVQEDDYILIDSYEDDVLKNYKGYTELPTGQIIAYSCKTKIVEIFFLTQETKWEHSKNLDHLIFFEEDERHEYNYNNDDNGWNYYLKLSLNGKNVEKIIVDRFEEKSTKSKKDLFLAFCGNTFENENFAMCLEKISEELNENAANKEKVWKENYSQEYQENFIALDLFEKLQYAKDYCKNSTCEGCPFFICGIVNDMEVYGCYFAEDKNISEWFNNFRELHIIEALNQKTEKVYNTAQNIGKFCSNTKCECCSFASDWGCAFQGRCPCKWTLDL